MLACGDRLTGTGAGTNSAVMRLLIFARGNFGGYGRHF